MKKILLVISVISMLLLAGCNKDEKIDNTVNTDSQQSKAEITSNEEKDEVESLYKLSDKYELDESSFLELYNVVLADVSYEEKSIENPYYFESDGKEYVIDCNRIDRSVRPDIIPDVAFDVTINGKEVPYLSSHANDSIVGVGVIDLDENDGRKEIVIRRQIDYIRFDEVYKVNADNELEEITSIEPRIISNKYIFPIFLTTHYSPIVIGYYTYESGELQYVDKLLTGESPLGSDGKFPDKIRNKIYLLDSLTQIEQDGKFLSDMYEQTEEMVSYKILSAQCKYNEELGTNELVYEIELISDARWVKEDDIDFEEIIPKGTIINNVSIEIELP